MNWGDLKADFAALLDRDDATSAQIEAWCKDGYLRVGRLIRLPTQEQHVELTVSVNGYITIPADYVKLRILWVAGGKLQKTTFDNILQWPSSTGSPTRYARVGNKWWLYPTPAAGSKVDCLYVASPPAVIDDNTTAAVFGVAAPLIIRAALVYAEDYFDGTRQGKWEAQFQQIYTELQEMLIDVDEGAGDAAVEPGYSDLEY